MKWLRRGSTGVARMVTSSWPSTFTLSTDAYFQRDFPRLRPQHCDPASVSGATPNYNCIAWAASESDRWWEPDNGFNYYWPPNVVREYTVLAYIEAYRSLGYEICGSQELEDGIEKIAIFADGDWPTHAARQLSNGKWATKFGRAEDINHIDLQCLTGGIYGQVHTLMQRRR